MFTIIDDIICPLIEIIGFMSCKTSKIISLVICALILMFVGKVLAARIFSPPTI